MVRKELQGLEEFEEAVREEIQISYEMDLPLHALSILLPGGPEAEPTRRLLNEIRRVDPVTALSPDEIALVLPNTGPDNAHLVAERLIAAVPGAEIGEAGYIAGDTPGILLGRARHSREG